MLTQLLVWSPLLFPAAAVLLAIAGTVRQKARNAAIRRDLASRSAQDRYRQVHKTMDVRFQEAFAKRRRTVRFNDLPAYDGFEDQIAAAAERYHYKRAGSKGKAAVYEITLPSEDEIAAASSLQNARERVRAEFGIDPFDKATTDHHLQRENREQRTINWFNGLMLMPAVVCLAITVVALGGGKTHDAGEERIVDGAPIFVVVTGVLTVVLAVPATFFIVKHYRRVKYHKNLATGPGRALAWEILTTQVEQAQAGTPLTY